MAHETARTKPQDEKKHPQFILAIDDIYFRNHNGAEKPSEFKIGVGTYPADMFFNEVTSHLVIREREWLDSKENPGQTEIVKGVKKPVKGDQTYRQVIPYTMFTSGEGDNLRFWAYLRTPKAGEERLVGEVSIGFGGHMDVGQIAWTTIKPGVGIVDLKRSLIKGASVEKREELRTLDPNQDEMFRSLTPEFTGQFIYSDATSTDKLHVALVMAVGVPQHMQLTHNEDELQVLGCLTATELVARSSSGEFTLESWTDQLLQTIIAQQNAARFEAARREAPPEDAIPPSQIWAEQEQFEGTPQLGQQVPVNLAEAKISIKPGDARRVIHVQVPDNLTVDEAQIYLSGVQAAANQVGSAFGAPDIEVRT